MSGYQEYVCNKCGYEWESLEGSECPRCKSVSASGQNRALIVIVLVNLIGILIWTVWRAHSTAKEQIQKIEQNELAKDLELAKKLTRDFRQEMARGRWEQERKYLTGVTSNIIVPNTNQVSTNSTPDDTNIFKLVPQGSGGVWRRVETDWEWAGEGVSFGAGGNELGLREDGVVVWRKVTK